MCRRAKRKGDAKTKAIHFLTDQSRPAQSHARIGCTLHISLYIIFAFHRCAGGGDDSKRDPARTRRIRTAHSLPPTAYCQHISLPYCTVARCDCEQVRYRYHVRQDSAINTQVRSRSPHATPRHAIVCREACFGLCTAGATSWMRELLADARRLGPAGRSAETGRVLRAAAAPV